MSGLEPIFGIAVALNLAFLNLPRFEYITRIKDRLEGRLSKLDRNVKSQFAQTKWYRQLEALAAVRVLSDPEPSEGARVLWIDAPGTWGTIYNLVFYWRLGRGFSIVSVGVSLSLVMIGSGYSNGAFSMGTRHFDAHSLPYFLLASAMAVWPLVVVGAGEFICVRANRFLTYQTDSLAQQVVKDNAAAVEAADDALSKVER